MSFAKRFKTIVRNRRRFHPVPEVSAGRAAELQVAKILDQRLRCTGWEYAAGLRVPDGRRRQEIDLVVTTPTEIWVVELKNWTGFVGLEQERVIQHRAGGRGVVDHGDLLSKMKRKQRALRRCLRRTVDDVPRLWSVLVFCNDTVGIDDNLVDRSDLDVVKLREFVGALPLDVDEPKQATQSIVDARGAMADIGTWDLLFLHGGQVVSGDLVESSVEPFDDRTRFRAFRIDVPRRLLDVFRSPLTVEVTAIERGGKETSFRLGFDETIRFHCAGQSSPKKFNLRDLVGVKLG